MKTNSFVYHEMVIMRHKLNNGEEGNEMKGVFLTEEQVKLMREALDYGRSTMPKYLYDKTISFLTPIEIPKETKEMAKQIYAGQKSLYTTMDRSFDQIMASFDKILDKIYMYLILSAQDEGCDKNDNKIAE